MDHRVCKCQQDRIHLELLSERTFLTSKLVWAVYGEENKARHWRCRPFFRQVSVFFDPCKALDVKICYQTSWSTSHSLISYSRFSAVLLTGQLSIIKLLIFRTFAALLTIANLQPILLKALVLKSNVCPYFKIQYQLCCNVAMLSRTIHWRQRILLI